VRVANTAVLVGSNGFLSHQVGATGVELEPVQLPARVARSADTFLPSTGSQD
jgi:hypothetical protein